MHPVQEKHEAPVRLIHEEQEAMAKRGDENRKAGLLPTGPNQD